MNSYQLIIADAKKSAEQDARGNTSTVGRSYPIRRRDGDTETIICRIGPRGGVRFEREVEPGWVLDHPADFGQPSY